MVTKILHIGYDGAHLHQKIAIYDVRCLSIDTKPTEGITNSSTCIEMDTGKKYMFDADSGHWLELPAGTSIQINPAAGGEFLMADYKVTDTELTSIANAIRTKGGINAQLEFPTEFVSAVNAISGGCGVDVNEMLFDPTWCDVYIEDASVSGYTLDKKNRTYEVTYHGGVNIGVRYAPYFIIPPGIYTSLHYKITTGTASYDTSLRFSPGIGLMPKSRFLQSVNHTEQNAQTNVSHWLKYAYTQERNNVLEGTFDLTDITVPFHVIFFLAGWDVTFSEVVFL